MAFSFFRKKQEPTEKEPQKAAATNSIPPAPAKTSAPPAPPARPCPAPIQSDPAVPGTDHHPRRHDERPAAQNSGNDKPIPLGALIRRKRKIFFDSSAMNLPGFKKLVDGNFADIRSSDHTFFIPEFEMAQVKDDASPVVQMLTTHTSTSVLRYTQVNDYAAFLPRVAVMSQEKGQLCFVVNSSDKRRTILAAAKSANVFVQLFSLDENGALNSGSKPEKSRAPLERRSFNKAENRSAVREDAFEICTTPERIRVVPIRVSGNTGLGSVVYDSNNQSVRLVQQEIVNPNAVTYSTNVPGVWAKIYNRDAVNTFMEAKVKRMISKKVERKGLCWPTDILRDQSGNFVGILVPPAQGEPLHLAIFKQAKLQTYFPDWTKKDLCDLALTSLRTIEYLHSMNILLGCINPAAIRVVSKDEVYFVDTDNYQIEGFPTLIYNVSFTPPELQGRRIYLCSKESENYSIAVLVFLLLMPGKTPYTIDKDTNASNAVTAKQFPFPNGKIHGDGVHAMAGMWRFMWSHLSPDLKDAFYQTFQKDGTYELADSRLTATKWREMVFSFRKDLDNPVDPESLKLYPRTFKRGKNSIFHTCTVCHVDHPDFYFNRRYFKVRKVCNSCINKQSTTSFVCQACRKTYFYTNETALFHEMKAQQDSGWHKQKYCAECKSKTLPCRACGKIQPYYYLTNGMCGDCYRKAEYTRRRCRDCGTTFIITNGEYEYQTQRGNDLPTRCKPCRDRRRNSY